MSQTSATVSQPIEVGEAAPDFSLPSAQGGVVALKEVIQKGPVFLWFSAGVV